MDESAATLNPYLYRRLRRCFGTVKVANRGEEMAAGALRDYNGSPRLAILSTGELYRVCCPFCSDTRHRLYISYRYGQRDVFGRCLRFLAHCHNETVCLADPDNQEDLWSTICGLDGDHLTQVKVKPGRPADEGGPIAWPGPCRPLAKLPPEHPARGYLEVRGFDPDRLSRVYRVRYCDDSHYYLARGRIIIPVFARGGLKGWQARHVGELDWKGRKDLPPKYFTSPGMQKRSLLYNFDRARQYATGVIVEGVSDVWAFGPMAVCTFGNAMSEPQRRLFLAAFRRRSGVLLYDPEAMAGPNAQRLARELAAALPGRFAAVTLPAGTDPGGLGREFLRDYVAGQAAEQGVEVRWAKAPNTNSRAGGRRQKRTRR